MNSENLEEQIDLKCPDCGGIEFDLDAPLSADEPDLSAQDDDSEPAPETPLQCAKCGKHLTYGELVEANADTVDERVQKIGADFAKDLTKNLEDAIKKMGFGKK